MTPGRNTCVQIQNAMLGVMTIDCGCFSQLLTLANLGSSLWFLVQCLQCCLFDLPHLPRLICWLLVRVSWPLRTSKYIKLQWETVNNYSTSTRALSCIRKIPHDMTQLQSFSRAESKKKVSFTFGFDYVPVRKAVKQASNHVNTTSDESPRRGKGSRPVINFQHLPTFRGSKQVLVRLIMQLSLASYHFGFFSKQGLPGIGP